MAKKKVVEQEKTKKFSRNQKIGAAVVLVLLVGLYFAGVQVYNRGYASGAAFGSNEAVKIVLETVGTCERGFNVPVTDSEGKQGTVTLTLLECFSGFAAQGGEQ